uniref:Uncharacterized protein n=1 Tax=Oryza glumipatula TaxID=40148 RepID=A0A0E0BF48_9ORYZ
MEMAGFTGVPLSYAAIRKGNDMVRRCGLRRCENKECGGCLLLCWSSRPLYSISAWRPAASRGAGSGSERSELINLYKRQRVLDLQLCGEERFERMVGAHGTGARLPPIDEQVISMKLVTPAKGTIELSREKDPDLFYLARCGLGGLGVVAEPSQSIFPINPTTAHFHQISLPIAVPRKPSNLKHNLVPVGVLNRD